MKNVNVTGWCYIAGLFAGMKVRGCGFLPLSYRLAGRAAPRRHGGARMKVTHDTTLVQLNT